MKKSKKIIPLAMALTMTSLMSVSAMAAEPVVTQDASEQTVYTQTIDLSNTMFRYGEQSRKVTSNKPLSLALDAGQSGETLPVDFRFTSLPAKARVRSVKIDPGNPTINNNSHNMMGSVLFNTIKVASPDGKIVTGAWNPRGMDFSSSFLDRQATGTWTISAIGKNIATPPVNPPSWAPPYFGSLSHKSPSMTITYIVPQT